MAVNATSVFLGTTRAAAEMAKTGGGSIINISSIMGFIGGADGHPGYSASKGAVRTPRPPRCGSDRPVYGRTL